MDSLEDRQYFGLLSSRDWAFGVETFSMPKISRRNLLNIAAASFCNSSLDRLHAGLKMIGRDDPSCTAQDEDFWATVQSAFVLDRTMVNFNNGGVCPSPRVVQDALRRYLEHQNQAPSYFMWRHLEPEVESVRKRLANFFGCDTEEIAITRNASESLETCLLGIELKSGDEVLTTDQDYPRMITTIKQRASREGVRLVQVKVPAVPKEMSDLTEAFERGITPRTRLILVSHVCFMNGQIYPVQEIVRLGKSRGIPVVVDGAHAVAQFPFEQSDLGCDYYGASLHKWLMAPIGTGMLYVRKDKIADVWPLMAAGEEQSKDIRKFEEIGTHPAANHNAIAEALTFHEMLGGARKAARLLYLRSLWCEELDELPNVRFHTNLKPAHSCGLTTVEILGIDSAKLQAWLFEKHSIWTTPIKAPGYGGIRVTPNVYTTLGEVQRFKLAMLQAARNGIDG